MEGKLQHFFHDHPLILETQESKNNDGTKMKIKCNGCLTPILGPFYSCKKCRYFLHKVCAEQPNKLDHPMHPKHPLTLFSKPSAACYCDLCRKACEGFFYRCTICNFDVDVFCITTSQTIEDKCHEHPLTPIQYPTSFPCNICIKIEEGVSYKCTICPFWVHQSCIMVPNTVKHSEHHHLLTLLQSVPFEFLAYSHFCDICHGKLSWFQCSYYCAGCMFFAHINCARTETTQSSSFSRDQNIEINQDSLPGQSLVLLPVQQKSTELISWFVENYINHGAKVNKSNYFLKGILELESLFSKEKHHIHQLSRIDKQINEKTCEACALPISPPSYGCIECDYFLHNCCTELPKYIHHPSHPGHLLIRESINGFFKCDLCYQWCNGFRYKCFECEGIRFRIDIKCASLLKPVYHEAHKHPLTPRLISSSVCSGCNLPKTSECVLKCDTCSFNLCFKCALAPPIVKHRYGKLHPFILTYSPLENHYNEYICEICEGGLNPKHWFYHCLYADQFTHITCMLKCGADSNIRYGKSYTVLNIHAHKLTYVRCIYDGARCNYCCEPLRTGLSVGFECEPCNFKIHLECLIPMDNEKEREAGLQLLQQLPTVAHS